jgi:hypothetical protein
MDNENEEAIIAEFYSGPHPGRFSTSPTVR